MPLLTHHAIVYGHAVHEAVRRHFEARLAGRPFSADDLVAAFRSAWVSEGFLSREHEEERRRQGEAMLRLFHAEEARAPWSPTAVEEDFAFTLERNRVQGRYDLVIEREGEVAIVDFKTGDVRDEKAAQKRAKESLQLDIYALAHLETKGRLPDRVELRFLESGLVAGRRPTPKEAAATRERIRTAAAGDPEARVRRPAHLHGLRPVPLPRRSARTRRGASKGRGEPRPERWAADRLLPAGRGIRALRGASRSLRAARPWGALG